MCPQKGVLGLKIRGWGGFFVGLIDFIIIMRYVSRMRLDQALVFRNLYTTRARAVAAIRAGLVLVNGTPAKKPSQDITDTDVLVAGDLPYSAGRGSLKLAHALDSFGVSVQGKVCLDIGASTGGFTEVLLNRGASRVYAVDVGTNQLSDKLRGDSRVVSLEQTDIRTLPPIGPVDLIVIDVSFISLVDIVDAVARWGAKDVIALIKPQFEVPRDIAARTRGVIKSQQWRDYAINRVVDSFVAAGVAQRGITTSPILGGSGNTEYLAWFNCTDNHM